jgi:D-alanyl-lipoteichoic acid acyltransferase DltB (MBOAT superfamily)
VTAYLPEPLILQAVTIVGLSYMLFRQVQFLVDAKEGQIEQASLWSYANYQLNLFTLLSGPIQRYQEYREQWEKLDPLLLDDHAIRKAYFRLLAGLIKLAVLGTVFLSLYQRSADALLPALGSVSRLDRTTAVGHFLGILYFFPLYLYLNFSGYCDIVIAGASLLGLKLPENFDRPYLSRNVIDYWTRWHRTLGFWIRDYLFLPLYKGVAVRWPGRADSLAFLCYFVAFFVAGIWHGPTLNFVVYGLLQGVGVSAAKLWERHLLKTRGRSGLREYLRSSRVRLIAIVGTLHFECASLLFFPVDVHTTLKMLEAVFKAVA